MNAFSAEQEDALACAPFKHCLVEAGPGSGKTFFLVNRVCRLLSVLPSCKIYCISFTNESSTELKKRVECVTGNARVKCSTIHRFCLNGLNSILRNTSDTNTKWQVIKSDKHLATLLASMISAAEKEAIIREVVALETSCDTPRGISDCGDDEERYDEFDEELSGSQATFEDKLEEADVLLLVRVIESFRWVRRGAIKPGQLSDLPVYRSIYKKYFSKLMNEGLIDLKLIISDFIRFFQHLRVYVRNCCEFLMVDEFQDLDAEQAQLVNLLIQEGIVVTVTGDVNQSIYGWRNAETAPPCKRYRQISNFDALICGNNTARYRLSINHRSTQQVVQASNKMIGDTCVSTARPEAQVGLAGGLICKSEIEELYKALQILRFLKVKDDGLGSTAVLFRLNSDKVKFLSLLKRNNIPSVSKQQLTCVRAVLRRTKSFHGLLAILEVMCNNADSFISAISLVCSNKEGIKALMNILKAGFPESDEPLLSKIKSLNSSPLATMQTRSMVNTFLSRLSKIERTARVKDMIDNIVVQFKLQKTKDIADFSSSIGETTDISDALKQLKEKDSGAKLPSVSDSVYVGTIHSAKGREWQRVILPLVNEGTVPCDRDGVDISEERRVLYVGMTRCIKTLIMTCTNGPSTRPSRFLFDSGIYTFNDINQLLKSL
jgi:DNA helicase-2/ATP-dependent DNA helicase PcrA